MILILIDTLRADHVGVLGAGAGRTPVLDELAQGGVTFERCYAQYPLTLPSTATLLASAWPNVHRVRENYDERLSERAATLAEAFAEAGYRTAAFVSALPVRAETGCAQGFDLYDDDFSEPFTFHAERLKPLESRWTGSERRGERTVARALEWLRHNRAPYFLFVHLFDPHSPYDAPEPHASRHPSPYAAEVAHADELVGRLLGGARAGGEEPVVAVVSDHGEGLGEHGEWAHGIFLYDATLHVPWILSAPGRLDPARVARDVRLLDVAPTLAELAGVSAPPSWAGESVVDLALGRSEPPRAVYAENWFTRSEYGWSELVAWIESPWKWIRAPRPELYDRTRDPGELENLAAVRTEVSSAMARALDRFLAESEARAGSTGTLGLVETIDPEPRVLDWLRSLGYLSGDDVPRRGALPDPKDRVHEWNARNDAHTHAGRGFALLERGEVDVALAAFEAAVGHFPTREALTGLGLTLLELGAPARAESTLASASALAPRDMDALVGHARALIALDRLEEAEPVLARACLVDSTRLDAVRLRASVLDRLGRSDAARAAYERTLAMDGADSDARQRLAELLLAAGRAPIARDHLRVLVEMRPWDPVALWKLGEAEHRSGDDAAARDALARARARVGSGAVGDSIDAALSRLEK